MFLEGMDELLKIRNHVALASQALGKDNGDANGEKARMRLWLVSEVPTVEQSWKLNK